MVGECLALLARSRMARLAEHVHAIHRAGYQYGPPVAFHNEHEHFVLVSAAGLRRIRLNCRIEHENGDSRSGTRNAFRDRWIRVEYANRCVHGFGMTAFLMAAPIDCRALILPSPRMAKSVAEHGTRFESAGFRMNSAEPPSTTLRPLEFLIVEE